MFGFKKPEQPKVGGPWGADVIHWPFTRDGKTEYTDCKMCAEGLDETGRYGSLPSLTHEPIEANV